MDATSSQRFQPSEGTCLYLLGLVIIATQPHRFWLGVALAGVPLTVSIASRTLAAGWPPR